jgi:hypothetical protein
MQNEKEKTSVIRPLRVLVSSLFILKSLLPQGLEHDQRHAVRQV